MASRFQAATLLAAPSYPNAVAWSDDNLIAVASDHLVTILSPAMPSKSRGLITIETGEPFPIGVVDRNDLLSPNLLPNSLSREVQSCVRSISWSPLGLGPNSGCLLAVCTVEGRVKLYRQPFCDFSAEWIEVMDVSNRLYDYLESIGFGELEVGSSKDSGEQETEKRTTDDASNVVLRKESKRRKANVLETDIGLLKENSSKKIVDVSKSKANSLKKIQETCKLPLISADKYGARSAMLSSLVVAWSPVLQVSPKICSLPQNGSSISLLAVGGKSGKVSLWRVSVPDRYSIEHSGVPTTAMIVGLLQAHASWVTAISWVMLDSRTSNPQVLLATGSSDGSIKIWLACKEQLLKSSEANNASFSLLKEVVTDSVPVSVISLSVPAWSPNKMLLAVGKGSGSLEVWICDTSNRKFDKFGSSDAHDNVVTGLAWAFQGRSLYSCSQDNLVRCWILGDDVLSEVPIPSNTPRLRSPTGLPNAFVSCFGLAVSPGNLVLAMVRNFDTDLLDPMYQKRTQKAAIEFFWIGAQEVCALSNDSSAFVIPGFPVKELVSWDVNTLWSLKQYECQEKPLVVWDVVAALLAFKRSAAEYVEHILVKWLSISYVGSHVDLPTEKVLLHVSRILSKISSRQLHLLNIICRRVVLTELKADQINSKLENFEGLDCLEEKLIMWTKLLLSSERELRERLVGLSVSACISLVSHSATFSSQSPNWSPVGLAQMERWVSLNHNYVQDQLRVLASEIRKHKKRLQSSGYVATEQCCYCSAPVPFESPEVAFCQGVGQGHKLIRCAVSMEICPITPTWFCTCCHRRISRMAPETLFALPGYPSLDFESSTESCTSNVTPKPLCPFCGILLQRLLPDFLLSASPV
ncbi:WD repeat containing protein [Parasponia andersonii]|uniref:WD repeat containing protein n=1 Tax=Parasponia andersonii TaxID=3476 RepID=A0A2P5DFA4_PARAD|nr:WD repeat containing protein [Parasponia andersonii]